VPKWLSLGLIVVIFVISFLYARRQGAVELSQEADAAASVLTDEPQ
jgi:hypothetical protein